MLRNRKIAAFIDVDNAVMEFDHYENVINQLRDMGEIVCATIYGVSERKHKKVIEDAKNNGFDIQLPSRIRRRVRKVFDDRIFVDVATLVATNHVVDTIAVVSAPTDLVHFYSFLRRKGLEVVAVDNCDEQTMALVTETLDLGKVETISLPKRPAPQPARPAPQPAPAPKAEPAPAPKAEPKPAPVQDEEAEKTARLLREIERLQKSYEQPAPKAEPAPAPKAEPAPQPEPAPAPQPELQPVASIQDGNRTIYVTQNDTDLIRRIEELRRSSGGEDSEELIEEIRKLLDGIE